MKLSERIKVLSAQVAMLREVAQQLVNQAEEFHTDGDFPAYAVTPYLVDRAEEALTATESDWLAKHDQEVRGKAIDDVRFDDATFNRICDAANDTQATTEAYERGVRAKALEEAGREER